MYNCIEHIEPSYLLLLSIQSIVSETIGIHIFFSSSFLPYFFFNSKDQNQSLPLERKFKIPNVDNIIEEGKKVPKKYRNMTLHSFGVKLKTDMYTEAGWPSVSGDALKILAGKVASEFDFLEDAQLDDDIGDPGEITAGILEEKPKKPEHIDKSPYGTAFEAFENPEDGREACYAIAALCQVCSIDSLISNFILPLQVMSPAIFCC